MEARLKSEVINAVEELVAIASPEEEDIFVLGCSTSEILGKHIGKNTDLELGELVGGTIRSILNEHRLLFAVQCCEHLNRALVVERETAKKYGLEEVNVVPHKNAGGGAATAAFALFKEPVVVEKIVAKLGLDIGDTAIGMHIKAVQVPVRLKVRSVGEAHVSALRSRLKMIGGARAAYLPGR